MPSTESTRTSKSKRCVPVERILDMASQSAQQAEIVQCACLRLAFTNLCVMPRVAPLRKVMTKREARIIKRLRWVAEMPIQTIAKVTERHKKTIYSVTKGKAKFAKRGPKESLRGRMWQTWWFHVRATKRATDSTRSEQRHGMCAGSAEMCVLESIRLQILTERGGSV